MKQTKLFIYLISGTNQKNYTLFKGKTTCEQTKFNKLNCDPTLSREGKLQRILRKLKKNGEIDDTTYKDIYPTGSQPARIYGLPKLHKVREPSSAPPFRPIVSSIGTYKYNLAKFLCTLLDSHIPNDFCARNTFSFVNEITNLRTSNKFYGFIRCGKFIYQHTSIRIY